MYVYKSTAESRVTNAVLRAISLATQDRAVAERRKAPVSACEPLCAILLRKASVYPLSPAKADVGRFAGDCDKSFFAAWYPLMEVGDGCLQRRLRDP